MNSTFSISSLLINNENLIEVKILNPVACETVFSIKAEFCCANLHPDCIPSLLFFSLRFHTACVFSLRSFQSSCKDPVLFQPNS